MEFVRGQTERVHRAFPVLPKPLASRSVASQHHHRWTWKSLDTLVAWLQDLVPPGVALGGGVLGAVAWVSACSRGGCLMAAYIVLGIITVTVAFLLGVDWHQQGHRDRKRKGTH